MFSSIGRRWELAKGSFRVLHADKELLIFPLLSFVALVIVMISFAVPFVMLGGITSAQGIAGIVAIVLLVAIIALIASALSGIFTASIYRYATKGDGGPMYNNQTLAAAFRQKR